MTRHPLPNDKIGRATVVASVYFGECSHAAHGAPDDLWTVLLLHPEPPYFEVAIIGERTRRVLNDDDTSGRIYNIVDALDVYQEWGGDR